MLNPPGVLSSGQGSSIRWSVPASPQLIAAGNPQHAFAASVRPIRLWCRAATRSLYCHRNRSIDSVKILRPPSFDLHRSVAIVRVAQLGALEKAVELLEHGLRQLFEAADTAKPVTKQRRGVPGESAGGATGQVVPQCRPVVPVGAEPRTRRGSRKRDSEAALHGGASRCIGVAITCVGDLSGTNGAHMVHYLRAPPRRNPALPGRDALLQRASG